MKQQELKEKVDKILSVGDQDPEASHSDEDELHLEVIKEFCPDWVVAEIDRLSEGDFARWCA